MISKDLTANIINQHCQHKSNDNLTNIKNKMKQLRVQIELTKLQNKVSDNQRCLLELNQAKGPQLGYQFLTKALT